MDDGTYAATARQRRGLADLIESFDAAALGTQSLCGRWTVRQVAGHLASAVSPPVKETLVAAVRGGGRFNRVNDLVARAMAERPPAELAAIIRSHAEGRLAPPLLGPRAPLTDALVHGGDMRVPLGLPAGDDDHDALRRSLEFITTGRPLFFVRRGWLTGLKLIAEDLDWTAGDGQAVQGQAIHVLMAACGRTAALGSLSGTGVDVLRSRITA